MNISISFRHMDASDALREYATSKLERICEKYVSGKVSANITFTVEKHRHIANFTLSISNMTVRAVEKRDDMYTSVDLALDKIEKQLRRHKDRISNHQPSEAEARVFRTGILASGEAESKKLLHEEDEFSEDYLPSNESVEIPGQQLVETASGEVKVLRQGAYEAKTLSIDKAVLQLELLDDRPFYVFTEESSGDMCIVYKRKDGTVGLIAMAK